MRSIGAIRKRALKKIVQYEYTKHKDMFGNVDHCKLEYDINEQIPQAWFDSWESAWSEIKNLVHDYINDLVYGRSL